MRFFKGAKVLTLDVFEVHSQKTETVFVEGRNFHSLTFRDSGKISITTKDDSKISACGDVTYVPKGVGYHTEILEPSYMIAVHFDMTDEADEIKNIEVLSCSKSRIFQNLFKNLFQKYHGETTVNYGCLSAFYEILSVFEEETEKSSEGITPRMTEAKKYIENMFADYSLSVEKLAAVLGISSVYLRKEFRQTFNISPSKYIEKVRMENAKAMLKSGYYTVGEVALRCGFSSCDYFSYAFKKQCGITPTQFLDI